MLPQDTDKDKLFAEYAEEHGFWKALKEFKISDKDEWDRLQKMMFAR